MIPEEIEKEIQSRVDFKMKELLTGIENTAKTNWHIAFHSTSIKHQHYWEAFNQMKDMLIKEMVMGLPYDEMYKRRKWEAKEKAVKTISELLDLRGNSRDQHKLSIIANAIEKAQV